MATNAIELLEQDHKHVKELLQQLSETTNRAYKKRKELLEKIHQELKIHTTIEEEIFYPAFKKLDGSESKEMYFEAMEEHRAVDSLIMPDLEKTDTDSDTFSGRAKVLKELVEHHADEEEDEMFKKARKLMSADQLRKLGEEMQARKEQLSKAMAR